MNTPRSIHEAPKTRETDDTSPNYYRRRFGAALLVAATVVGGGKAAEETVNSFKYHSVDSVDMPIKENAVEAVSDATAILAERNHVDVNDVSDQVYAAQDVDAELRALPSSNGEVHPGDKVTVTLEKNAFGYKVVADPANIPELAKK